ncbi:hypothetical protein [Arundinibacter roseus]|uniref:Uncharacterized protein n=1 Tax=Arundinibacter roseus TaxID=2070510 RepID=A0A4R4KK70_9BACT|nr:hypothetical protein [Arundinibacter roseus]TDB67079.1 hypothetical protein EZE20_08170 [Arundinibacter roseus]
MQLSLVEHFPELTKYVFLDIYAKMCIDPKTHKPTLVTMEGQRVPADLKIRCKPWAIQAFPEGTVYKLDVRLIQQKDKKPYFSAVKNYRIFRAIEFFEHNLSLQKGLVRRRKGKDKVLFIRNDA